jgi:hypothetical protein
MNGASPNRAELLASAVDTGQLAARAAPTLIGQRRVPGLKLNDDRVIRLLETLVVYRANTSAEAARFPLGPDCSYRVALPPGSYRVERDRRGMDFSKDLPRTVTITAGQTTRLDVSIDTGIR